MRARKPDIPSFPAIAEAYCVLCTSSKSAKLSLISDNVVLKVLVLPSESTRLIPKASIAVTTVSVGEARFVIIFLREVPDCEPFIPALAIRPMATDISSME